MAGIRVTAPAKVILHGEHSVVYGKTALAASVDLRTTLTVQASPTTSTEVHLPDLGLNLSWPASQLAGLRERLEREGSGEAGTPLPASPDTPHPASPDTLAFIRDFLSSASSTTELGVVAFLHLYLSLPPSASLPPLSFTLSSDIPLGAGLGSSAAMSVCLSAGLYLLHTRPSLVRRAEVTLATSHLTLLLREAAHRSAPGAPPHTSVRRRGQWCVAGRILQSR